MKKIGILYHPKIEATRVKAAELHDFVVSQGVFAWMGSSWEKAQAEELLGGTDLLLTVGGDGTILRAAQIALDTQIPITGINLGRLGFLTELEAGEAVEKLPALLDEEGWIDERTMLQVEVASGGAPQIYHALNDVVLARGEIARMVKIGASVDGQYLTTYRADGLIIATATGSTGYALAAGGPIMYPWSRDLLMIPVAPHLCLDGPLVLPEEAEITMCADTYLPATLSIDGHINRPLSGGDTLRIKHSSRTTRFRRIRPREYFYNILEEKLRGKQGESRKG